MSAQRLPELAVVGRRLCEPLTGVGRYLECLLRWWGRMEIPFERIRVYAPGEPNLPADALSAAEVTVVPGGGSPLVWENLHLVRRLSGRELLFGPYTLPWFHTDRGVVANLGIYDSRPQDFPWWAKATTTPQYRHSARHARAVIANSTSTKNDVVRYLGAAAEKVHVVLLAADESLTPGEESPAPLPAEIRQKYSIPEGPFFLFAGKLSKRRNVPMLIEALAQAGVDERLVVVGPDHWGVDPPAVARGAGVGDRIIWTPHAPMDDLAHFYRGATAFVLPTEHEGFSLTIPEAMACGAPALVFDHASLEGGLRDAVLLVEPRTAEGLAAALRSVARDPVLRARLSAQSLACAAHYRWERTAAETMAILARAAAIDWDAPARYPEDSRVARS